MKSLLRFGFLAAAVTTTAYAENLPKKNSDPNRIICKTDDVIGSRLEKVKTCLTAQQWADQKNDERQQLEHAQTRSK